MSEPPELKRPQAGAEHDEGQPAGRAVELVCGDGVRLGGHLWPVAGTVRERVILNPATGVPARYYHRYARFLAENGLETLTYDYRGIGASRPPRLAGCGYRWRHWGEQDFEAALAFMAGRREGPLLAVGHSIGGFLPGFAPSAPRLMRILTVGAQYAWWKDYAEGHRARLFLRWHLAMPLATVLCGYFPGKRLGWLEDLPAGVANEWSFRRARMERSYPAADRPSILARFAAVDDPILAVAPFDDEYAPPAAVRRALSYYSGAERSVAILQPQHLGATKAGHFALFHDRFRPTFWQDSLAWLLHGRNPWSEAAAQCDSLSANPTRAQEP